MAVDPVRREGFINAACWHGSLDDAERMLVEHPELRSADIHIAAVLGDEAAVRRFIAQDRASVVTISGPWGGDPLNYLGLSKYLRLKPERTDEFLRTATALLDAGAPAQTGFWNKGEFETALYGAAGVAHNAPLTRLLVERGADPNDPDTCYHVPEGWDSGAMKVLVETGRITPDNLAMMLIRKIDWHDLEGVRYLLERGTNPDYVRGNGSGALGHALLRDNDLPIIELLLDHGSDPLRADGRGGLSGAVFAARRGRGDVLEALERRGVKPAFEGVDRLYAALARGDAESVRSMAKAEPGLVRQVLDEGATRLAEFTITWNLDGVKLLLELGVPAASRYEGYPYLGVAKDSTALHIAAWLLLPRLVKLFVEQGVPADATDGQGRTPLQLAVRGCLDSYWTERRTPEPARLLLEAGAGVAGVPYPTGYAELDAMLKAHGA